MTPDELYAHSLGIRLDAPIKEPKPKAVAPRPVADWADCQLDEIRRQPHVTMSEDTYNLLICCNHGLHDEADRLRARLRKAREIPWWHALVWFALAVCAIGWIAGVIR
jgi:hypothetical protein